MKVAIEIKNLSSTLQGCFFESDVRRFFERKCMNFQYKDFKKAIKTEKKYAIKA